MQLFLALSDVGLLAILVGPLRRHLQVYFAEKVNLRVPSSTSYLRWYAPVLTCKHSHSISLKWTVGREEQDKQVLPQATHPHNCNHHHSIQGTPRRTPHSSHNRITTTHFSMHNPQNHSHPLSLIQYRNGGEKNLEHRAPVVRQRKWHPVNKMRLCCPEMKRLHFLILQELQTKTLTQRPMSDVSMVAVVFMVGSLCPITLGHVACFV